MDQVSQSKRGRGRPSFDVESPEMAAFFRESAERFHLARDGAIPLWVQMKNMLEEAITDRRLAPLTRLPSEQGICDLMLVSRPVVRAAIGALVAEGLVLRLPRKGMFVAERKFQTDFLSMPVGVFGDMTAKGYKVDTRTYEYGLRDAGETERKVFGLPEKSQVLRIKRVYLVDSVPLTLTHISLPAHRVEGMEAIDIGNRSIFETIRQHYGLTVQRADRWFRADMPNAEAVKLMNISPDRPVIGIESIAYDHDGLALEYYWAYYNSDAAWVHISVS